MPPVPKKKTARLRTGRRRAKLAEQNPVKANISICAHCQSPKESHMLCKNCGQY